MENIKGFIAIAFTALLISCGTTKDSVSAKAEMDRGRNNMETTTNSSSRTATNSRTAQKEANERRLAEIEEEMQMKRMYSDLDMAQSQITDFERQWNASKTSWKSKNPSQAMNNYERIENQDRILKGILDDNQFESYQQWVRDNAAGE